MQQIKGLVIDPYTQSMKRIEFVPTLDNIYAILGCDIFSAIHAEGMINYHDDEYLLTTKYPAFAKFDFIVPPIGGRSIFFRMPNGEGSETSITEEQIIEIKLKTTWPVISDKEAIDILWC